MIAGFNIGDKVRLKSGGPTMRVSQLRKDEQGALKLGCVWFEGPVEVEEMFPSGILDLVSSRSMAMFSAQGD